MQDTGLETRGAVLRSKLLGEASDEDQGQDGEKGRKGLESSEWKRGWEICCPQVAFCPTPERRRAAEARPAFGWLRFTANFASQDPPAFGL
ncbi:hypothetical protein BGZ61DRAFT_451102 [Ilyonectria robusta]|uniref:uncharacterized protein n=1 Tax=Ilyonectria robusta TaxID=1079257 RepID=UPI001E8CFEB5|nr:uncharacterized protein BGZ61DRAFT_451102 [Ilyonectria robusta]KAH8699668.1 hypothetical protein BGZ61DRAFT_451102 [Ilyonectria robusta]